MKKCVFVVLALLVSQVSYGQLAYLQYRVVSDDNVEEFIEKETKYWSKVAQEAIDQGHLSGWSLWRKISVTEAESPNFVFVNTYESIEKADPSKVWTEENLRTLGVSIENAQTDSIAPVAFDYWMQVEDVISGDHQFAIVNYAMPVSVGAFIEENKSLWKPLFEESIESGVGGMKAWGIMSVIFPRGSEGRFSVLTWDGFDSVADVMNYMRYTAEPPDAAWDKVLSNSKMDEINPGGFKSSIVYEKVMSLSAED